VARALRADPIDDLDEELKAWLQESHDLVGMQEVVKPKPKGRAAPGAS
jgi:hypothetical protein